MSIPFSFIGDCIEAENISGNSLDKFFNDIAEAESISQLLLVATLQFLVKNNLKEFDFSYSLLKAN